MRGFFQSNRSTSCVRAEITDRLYINKHTVVSQIIWKYFVKLIVLSNQIEKNQLEYKYATWFDEFFRQIG